MIEYNRDVLTNKYHRISIKRCPYNVILKVIGLGNELVTIENYKGSGASNDTPQQMTLGLNDGEKFDIKVTSMSCNFEVQKSILVNLLDSLNNPSFYAVFHQKSLKFVATDLPDLVRYRALDNFGWNLEISTPNNSIEYAFFASPNLDLANRIEEILKG